MDVSLNQATYERLKKDIMMFVLKPGESVSASKIATRYGVSRTPAREALVRLQDDGLVDIFPQSKSVISKIRVNRIHQEWFVRKSLEMGMVDSLFKGVTKDDIAKLKECAEHMRLLGKNTGDHESAYEYILRDDQFHRITYLAAGESLSAEIIANTLPNYRRARLLIDLENRNRDRTIGDHLTLIEKIEKQDVEGYRTALNAHISHVGDDLMEMKTRYPEMFEDEQKGDS
ncbi:MAG: GntR family transcriptional regulator, partial [Lachnospiraceae bacterium]|nr:GntR family transcriptional regulator [Lachnospiraceae bacterium]